MLEAKMESKEILSFFADLPIGIKDVKIEIKVIDIIEARDILKLLEEKGYKPRGAYWKSTSSLKMAKLKKK